VRPLAGEVGDDRALAVWPRLAIDARFAPQPRAHAVGPHDEARRQRAAVAERENAGVDAPRYRDGLARREHFHRPRRPRGAYRFDERSAQLAVLDDPGERALTQLVGGKADPAAVVAAHLHGLDRGEPLGGQSLPRADGAEELGASRAERVDPRVPILRTGRRVEARRRAAVGERHGEALARERRGQRHPHWARAHHDRVVLRRCAQDALGSRTSITWFWLV
jgi:hypothetical protein